MTLDPPSSPLTRADSGELGQALQPAAERVRTTAPPTLRYAEAALEAYRCRRRRDRCFGKHAQLFREPAWDMMLDLYAAIAMGKQVSITSATTAACVPPTTALRQVRFLEDNGLIARTRDPSDRRRYYLALTHDATAMMDAWFERIWHNGRPHPSWLEQPSRQTAQDLEKENLRLRRAVSDLTLDKLVLQEAVRGNF